MRYGSVEDLRSDHLISVEGSDVEFGCAGNDVLVRAALRAGIDLPYECNMGGCGACKVRLVTGEVETTWPEAAGLSDRDRKKGNILACQASPTSDCRIALRQAPVRMAKTALRPARRVARLVARKKLSPTLFEFEFSADGRAEFIAGQYALLTFPGIDGARAYSMANESNSRGLWKFIIRRVPNGKATNFLYDYLNVGDCVTLDAPYGRAHWAKSERPVICLAGGSGLAPMIAVANAASEAGDAVDFFFGVSDVADVDAHVNASMLIGLKSSTVVVSGKSDSWSGETGFLHEALERRLPFDISTSYEYYMAGPGKMIDAILEMLIVKRKVPHNQIHFDKFV